MPLHPAIGSVQFPGGGVPRQGGFNSIFGNAPVAIGPGSSGYFPSYGGSPAGTPRSPSGAGSGQGGAIKTFQDIANIFTQVGQGYRLFAGGQDVVVVAPSTGPPTRTTPGTAGFGLEKVLPYLLIGGIAFAGLKLFQAATKK